MYFNNKAYEEILRFIKESDDSKVELVAISKNHPIESVENAILAGIRVFGENRVQEALIKFKEIKVNRVDITLHLTGPLQRNKVKQALEIFDVFHTLDRQSLAKEFKKYENRLKFKKFFIQINTGDEASKSGIHPNKAGDFISHCVNDLKINVVGLMCIPPVDENGLTHFDCIKEIAKKNNLGNLSMGMSNDFKAAIKSGSTHIRVGSLLFGKRI